MNVLRAVKKQNLITVHILTVHPVLISHLQFRRKTNTPKKSFNIKGHTVAVNG